MLVATPTNFRKQDLAYSANAIEEPFNRIFAVAKASLVLFKMIAPINLSIVDVWRCS